MGEDFRNWRAAVTAQVRFKPDRAAIEQELTAHYEDHVRDLERLDYPPELARQRALTAMGDPETIGKALDRVHKPWLGRLWQLSRALVWVACALTLLTLLYRGWPDWSAQISNSWEGIGVELACPPPVQAGPYRLEVTQVRYVDNQETGRGQLHLDLRCTTLKFWLDGPELMDCLEAVDSNGTVSGNTFTSENLGALDGISYAGKAEPVDFDSLCSTEGVPELFSQLELTFVADGITVAVVPFQYGEGIESLPEIPAKKGYSAAWPDLDYTHLNASQTLEAEYTPYTSALSDGGELPEILVDGSFSSRAEVSHTIENVTWSDRQGKTHTGTAYTVTVDDPDLEQVSYTVHYRLPDSGKHYALWVQEESGWSEADFEIDGQYLLLTSQTEEIIFCITERSSSLLVWLAAGTGCLLLLAAVFCVLRHIQKKRH